MRPRLLPRSFKPVGLIVAVLAFLIPVVFGMLQSSSWEQAEPRRKIANAILLIGLLLVVMAKEKVEDEFIGFCRLRAFRAAILAGLLYFLLDYVGIFKGTIAGSAFGLMLAEIVIYLAVFYASKTGMAK
ncbi:MAG: hypothetical protein EOP48_27320 [Sphingobacteriales bacterium]|nr:MAG: hypothetical protein EOP48_27320 [Sphingobacteriales bacterium]